MSWKEKLDKIFGIKRINYKQLNIHSKLDLMYLSMRQDCATIASLICMVSMAITFLLESGIFAIIFLGITIVFLWLSDDYGKRIDKKIEEYGG